MNTQSPTTHKSGSKDLNLDLNIMPVLDILSTLIVFLLISAVWIQFNSLGSENANGVTSIVNNKPEVTLEAVFEGNYIFLNIKNSNTARALTTQKIYIQNSENRKSLTQNQYGHFKTSQKLPMAQTTKDTQASVININSTQIEKALDAIITNHPNIKNAIIIPNQNSPYQTVVTLMDLVSHKGVKQIALGYKGE